MDDSEMYSNKSLSEAIRERLFAGTTMRGNDTESIFNEEQQFKLDIQKPSTAKPQSNLKLNQASASGWENPNSVVPNSSITSKNFTLHSRSSLQKAASAVSSTTTTNTRVIKIKKKVMNPS